MRSMVVALLAKASPQAWLPAYTSLIKEKPGQAIAAWDDCYAHQVVRQGLLSGDMDAALAVVDFTSTPATGPHISELPTTGSLPRRQEAQVRGVTRPVFSSLLKLERAQNGRLDVPAPLHCIVPVGINSQGWSHGGLFA